MADQVRAEPQPLSDEQEMSMTLIRLLALGGFIFIYATGFLFHRFFLHRLAIYPGPWIAKLTNLYAAYHAWKGDIHLDIARCHDEYGDFVRYGPNRVLVNTATGIKDIYGSGKNVCKSTSYLALTHRVPNTFTLADKKEHAWKRRILTQGFSDSVMRSYEPDIFGYVQKLSEHMIECDIKGKSGEWTTPKNMSDWGSYLSFDVMSKVVFGQEYNLLGDNEHRPFVKDIKRSNVRLAVFFNDRSVRSWRLDKWLFPEAMKGRNAFLSYISRFLSNQKGQDASQKKNLFTTLQHAKDPETGDSLSLSEMRSEAAALIAAGMETTSTAFASIFFYLSHFPEVRERLTTEIREAFPSPNDIKLGPKLSSCKYLQACISESMRMSPPAGGPLWREVQTGGATIDGHPFPAGSDVGMGIYAVHRNANIFPDPYDFKPERWMQEGNSIMRSAYVPFSTGQRGCVGKPLSLTELTLGTAYLVWCYDMRIAQGFLGDVGSGGKKLGMRRQRRDEFQLYDHINSASDGPYIVFRARQDKQVE